MISQWFKIKADPKKLARARQLKRRWARRKRGLLSPAQISKIRSDAASRRWVNKGSKSR